MHPIKVTDSADTIAARHEYELEKSKKGKPNLARLKELKAKVERCELLDIENFRAKAELEKAKAEIKTLLETARRNRNWEKVDELEPVHEALECGIIELYKSWRAARKAPVFVQKPLLKLTDAEKEELKAIDRRDVTETHPECSFEDHRRLSVDRSDQGFY